MPFKYHLHNAPNAFALEQAARIGCNMAIVHSVGPCSHYTHERDPQTGRTMDEFPQYFDAYPRIAELRRNHDAPWIERLRREVGALCERSVALGMRPAFHFYEPMLPFMFEREYPELVPVWRRPTQDGVIDVHTHLDPDNPETWTLIKNKYKELAGLFPSVAMMILTTWDGAGSRWCAPPAKMPIAERLAKMCLAAREGVREVRGDCQICFRLWGRNWPDEFYRDGHRLIGEVTGLENASELMEPTGKPHNDPEKVLPKVFEMLPPDVPIMYKSTRMDIYDNTPLTLVLGRYPAEREQIMEISYELIHRRTWPWCKVRHLRTGLEAAREHKLAGVVTLPINMGNNTREENPETGCLGRMNTWLLEQLLEGDTRSDAELLAEWLEKEFGAPAPQVVIDAMLEAERISSDGMDWGRGINARARFGSLHNTKLYWMYDGFTQPDFPAQMANPTRELLEGLMTMKHEAHRQACEHFERIEAARAAIPAALYVELAPAWQTMCDFILLCRDWHCYLLMQYAIERKVYPPERKVLGRMSRYAESFIRNLHRLRETEAGKQAAARMSFPDNFALT